MQAKWLIVGAGFTGCTLAERIASQLGEQVLLIDRRSHIGGNAFDSEDDHGLLTHRYGPHIFHTHSLKVWQYLSLFTEWRNYEHKVLGLINGKLLPLPFNMNSLALTYPSRTAERIRNKLLATYGLNSKVPVLKLRESGDVDIRALASYIYDNIFLNYTLKQWELSPQQLDPSVTGRVPVRLNYDDRYFEDIYQAMPYPSYSTMFARMLDHPNIELLLGVHYGELTTAKTFDRTIFTGPIDEFFRYSHGVLPYRSLRFEHENLDRPQFQPVGTVNYPNDERFTRITEQKYITGQLHSRTAIVREYPERYVPGENEPYYPVPQEQNRRLHDVYKQEAIKLGGSVIFTGRLGEYRYYNMDQAVARALKVFEGLAA
jgi:UDP-galactopyranose mutase